MDVRMNEEFFENSFISITCVTGGGRRDEKGETTNEINGNRMDG
jgi:hypothetical protein